MTKWLKKGFKPIKSLARRNECDGSIEDIGIGIEGMYFGTIQKDVSKKLMIGNIYRKRNTGNKRNENISRTSESVALQNKMLGSFRTKQTSTYGRGAIGKVVIFTMFA